MSRFDETVHALAAGVGALGFGFWPLVEVAWFGGRVQASGCGGEEWNGRKLEARPAASRGGSDAAALAAGRAPRAATAGPGQGHPA